MRHAGHRAAARFVRDVVTLGSCLCGLWVARAFADSPQSSAPQQVQQEPIVLLADYENDYFRKNRIALPNVRLALVEDRRGGKPEALGGSPAASVALGESVTTYLRRAFKIMVPPAATTATIPISVAIERFEIVHQEKPQAECLEARLAIARLDSTGAVDLGWVQASESETWILSPDGARQSALYRGTAALAQGLANRELGLAPGGPRRDAGAGRPTVAATYVNPNPAVSFGGPYMVYQGFTSSTMDETFGELLGVGLEGTFWLSGGSGIRLGSHYTWGSGTAPTLDPAWQYQQAEVEIGAVAFEVSYLHRLLRDAQAHRWFPYAGLGIGFLVGSEKTRVKASYDTGTEFGSYESEVTNWRSSFNAHALLGTRVSISTHIAALIEGRWTQAGDGSQSTVDPVVDQLVRRPDFNFTGWGVRFAMLVRD